MRNRLSVLAASVLAVVVLSCRATAHESPRVYEVRFRVEGIPHGQPVKKTSVRITGPSVRAVDGPAGTTPQTLASDRGQRLGDASSITVDLEPGEYYVKFTHPAYDANDPGYLFQIPPPGLEDETELDFVCQIRLNRENRAHKIVAYVQGETDSILGPKRLTEAKVSFWSEDRFGPEGRPNLETFTNAFGIAVLKSTLVTIGDTVKVRAEAEGYAPQEATFILGESPLQPASKLAGALKPYLENPDRQGLLLDLAEIWQRYVDGVEFTLRKSEEKDKPKPNPSGRPALIFEVVDFLSGKPISRADVKIEALAPGEQHRLVTSKRTYEDGKTIPILLDPPKQGGTPASYRAKVSADGFMETWSDIPDELLQPGKPRTYVVQLSKKLGGPRDHWTAAERAAYDRMAAWAKTKPLDKEAFGKQLYIEPEYIQVSWKELKSDPNGPPYHKGFAKLTYFAHKPGDTLPVLPGPSGKTETKVVIGKYPATLTVDRQLRRIQWFQGWFSVEVMYQSQWLIKPTVEEALAVAQEVSGVIGDPGK